MSYSWVQPIDCREGLKKLEDCSTHLVLTDPPYFIDGMGSDWDHSSLKKRAEKAGVVGSLPVGMKFDVKQGIQLQKFMKPICQELLRVTRPGGFFLCFTQNRLVHRMAVSMEESGFEIRDVLLWQYQGQPKAFKQDHFVERNYIKGRISKIERDRLIDKLDGRKTPQLKPQGEMIVLAQKPKEGTFVHNWDKYETGLIDVSQPYLTPEKFPGTVIPVAKPTKKYNHMTPKPIDLLRHLIRIFSIKGGGVLDPFAGSGSTGVAARLEKRDFVGFENDTKTAIMADLRIKGCMV